VTNTFVLSPARCNGPRAELFGRKLEGDAPIGEIFSWLSALYFRGKLAYARAFAPQRTFVMAPGRGLLPPDTKITARDLRAMGEVDIESDAFVRPLRRDAERLRAKRVVLLGSIATGKYVDTLAAVFGERLMFPSTFVGRGDMSRGGLMLRAAKAGSELAYEPVLGAKRHGKRPPKLEKP